jgi:transcriptional regulator with XRE-family HTH domain
VAERKARGLSQRALAQLAGLDRTHVGSVERGERNVSIDNVERLAEALGIELADLFKRIRP